MSLLKLDPSAAIVSVEHPIKKWQDKDTKKELVSDNLLVSVWASPYFGVLRFKDPSPAVVNSFKVGGKIPPLGFDRIAVEKGVLFVDCHLEG